MIDSLGLIFRPRYNITALGLENFHPFDTKKYGRIFGYLKDTHCLITKENESRVWKPSFPTRETMLYSTSAWHLFWCNFAIYCTKIAEAPICFLPGSIIRLL